MYIALETAELLAEEYLLPPVGNSHILVRSITTSEALVWWPTILRNNLTIPSKETWGKVILRRKG